jgi:hypothetical protein
MLTKEIAARMGIFVKGRVVFQKKGHKNCSKQKKNNFAMAIFRKRFGTASAEGHYTMQNTLRRTRRKRMPHSPHSKQSFINVQRQSCVAKHTHR